MMTECANTRKERDKEQETDSMYPPAPTPNTTANMTSAQYCGTRAHVIAAVPVITKLVPTIVLRRRDRQPTSEIAPKDNLENK